MKPSILAMASAAQAQLPRLFSTAPPEMLECLGGITMILNMLKRDWDTVFRDTAGEISQIKQLLERGAAMAPPPLAAALAKTAKDARVSLDLSLPELETIHDQLTEAMIELQAWLEDVQTAEALTLARDLDAYLFAAVKREVLEGPAPW